MRAVSIVDRRFPIFDVTGAARWRPVDLPPRSGGYLRRRDCRWCCTRSAVHSNLGRVPRSHAVVEITIPGEISVETVAPDAIPGWDAENQITSLSYGDKWLEERRSAILLVPSAVSCGCESNVLPNAEHTGYNRAGASRPQEMVWDEQQVRCMK
jgi:RES domain-containing protein